MSCSHDVQGGELEPRGMAEHGTWPRNLAAPQALQSRCERRLSPATFRSRCSRTGARMATRCAKRVGGRRVAGEAARGLVLWRMRVDFRGQISWDAEVETRAVAPPVQPLLPWTIAEPSILFSCDAACARKHGPSLAAPSTKADVVPVHLNVIGKDHTLREPNYLCDHHHRATRTIQQREHRETQTRHREQWAWRMRTPRRLPRR